MTEKRKLMLGAVGILLIVLVVVFYSQKQGFAVETMVVEKREIVRTVLASGHFQAVEKHEIMARDPIMVKDVLVKAGDDIEKGQRLAVLDVVSIEAEKRTIMAELAGVNTQLVSLETILPLQKAQIKSEMLTVVESLKQAQNEVEAMTRLYQLGAVSEMDWRQAQNDLAVWQSKEQAIRTQKAQIESQAILIKQYQEQKEALHSRLQVLEEKLNYYQMRASLSGKVREVYAEVGTMVGVGAPLFLLSTSDLMVSAEILAQDAPSLAGDQKVLISGEVLSTRVLPGKIKYIHPQAVEKMSELGVVQQRIPIEIMFNETVENMLPGYPVEVKIITAEKMALAVPREAVFTVKNQDGVFIVKKRRAIFTPVEIGI